MLTDPLQDASRPLRVEAIAGKAEKKDLGLTDPQAK